MPAVMRHAHSVQLVAVGLVCGARLEMLLLSLLTLACHASPHNPAQVRRPGVLESVCLDLHLMRGVAMQLRNVPEVGAAPGWGGPQFGPVGGSRARLPWVTYQVAWRVTMRGFPVPASSHAWCFCLALAA